MRGLFTIAAGTFGPAVCLGAPAVEAFGAFGLPCAAVGAAIGYCLALTALADQRRRKVKPYRALPFVRQSRLTDIAPSDRTTRSYTNERS